MQISLENTGALARRLTVSIEAEKVEQKINKKLQELAHTVRMDGFRPGKVPLPVVSKRFRGPVRGEVIEELIKNSFEEAITKSEERLAQQPHIDFKQNVDGEAVEYVATFDVMPKIEQINLSGLIIEKPTAEISATDLNKRIEQLQRRFATWEKVERAAAKGDKLTISLKGTLDGEEISDVGADELSVDLGGNELLAGFDELLLGVKPNDSLDKPFTFPAEHVNKKIAGKTLQLSINVKEITEAKLPELNEEFFTKLHLEEKTQAALEEKLKEAIGKEITRAQFTQLKKQIFKFLNEANPIEVPTSLVANQEKQLRQQVQQRLQGADIAEEDLNEDLAGQLNTQAIQTVRVSLLLGKYIEDNKLVADAARVNERLMNMLMPYAMRDQALFRQLLDSPMPKQIAQDEVLEEVAIEHIAQTVTPVEKAMSLEELLALPVA